MASAFASVQGDPATPSIDASSTIHVMVSSQLANNMQEYVLDEGQLLAVGSAYTPTPEQLQITAGSLLQGATLLVYRVALTNTSFQVRAARRALASDAFVIDDATPVLLQASADLDTPVLSDDCSTLYYADLSEVTFAFATQ